MTEETKTQEMQLVWIDHERCGEMSGEHTLLWAPVEMTRKELREKVYRAQTAYLAQSEIELASTPPNDYSWGPPPYKKYPERTVAEIDREWATKKLVWESWKASADARKRPFGKYLEAEGLVAFWEHHPTLYMELGWGHRHGMALDYAETVYEDKPGPDGPIKRSW